MKDYCLNKYQNILNLSYQNFNVVLEKGLVLNTVLEKWKSAVDNKRNFGALLTDLSKVFDRLPHDLLLSKLIGYGFILPALRF